MPFLLKAKLSRCLRCLHISRFIITHTNAQDPRYCGWIREILGEGEGARGGETVQIVGGLEKRWVWNERVNLQRNRLAPSPSFLVLQSEAQIQHSETHTRAYKHTHAHRRACARVLSWASSNFQWTLKHPTVSQHAQKYRDLLITDSSIITYDCEHLYSLCIYCFAHCSTNRFWLRGVLAAQGMRWVT